MAYKVELSKNARKQLDKLDRPIAVMILKWLKKNVDGAEDPRSHGKALQGNLAGYWRYRVGDYRIVCTIDDGRLVVLAIIISNRKNVYADQHRSFE